MHEAVCNKCGKRCEVPFRPTGEKPVYCRDCFAGNTSSGQERFGNREHRERRDFTVSAPLNAPHSAFGNEIKKQLEEVNARLERLISAVQILAEAHTTNKTISSKKKTAKKVAKKISAKK